MAVCGGGGRSSADLVAAEQAQPPEMALDQTLSRMSWENHSFPSRGSRFCPALLADTVLVTPQQGAGWAGSVEEDDCRHRRGNQEDLAKGQGLGKGCEPAVYTC